MLFVWQKQFEKLHSSAEVVSTSLEGGYVTKGCRVPVGRDQSERVFFKLESRGETERDLEPESRRKIVSGTSPANSCKSATQRVERETVSTAKT